MDAQDLGELRRRSAHVAARTEIADVRCEELSGVLISQPPADTRLSFDLNREITVEVDESDWFIVRAVYVVVVQTGGRSGDTTETSRDEIEPPRDIAKLSAHLAALFTIDPDRKDGPAITKDDIRAYAESMGLFALHPYAREALRDLSVRLSLPPLTIGVLRIDTAAEVTQPTP